MFYPLSNGYIEGFIGISSLNISTNLEGNSKIKKLTCTTRYDGDINKVSSLTS